MRVAVELIGESAGTFLRYEVWAKPRNALGRVAIPLEIGRWSRARFERAFRRYDRQVQEEPLPREKARLASGGGRRLSAAREVLREQGQPDELVGRLASVLEHADDLTVTRLRPYALADTWGATRRDVLELFLHATRAGLLEFRWDLLCPLCRGPAAERGDPAPTSIRTSTARAARSTSGVEFEHSVELTFRPARAIREVEAREFCVGGPQVTPHIVAQQLLAPGEERRSIRSSRPGTLPSGTARRRRGATVRRRGGRVAPTVAPRRTTARTSSSSSLERTAWSDQAVGRGGGHRAAGVPRPVRGGGAPPRRADLGRHADRPLHRPRATRPGSISRSATRPPSGSVIGAFRRPARAVAAEGGAVVKAMGDAIMAVFTRPLAAVRAMRRAQASWQRPAGAAVLAQGRIHPGPCIAVTQNGRLDYFGSTVNLAARLVDLSSGADLVVSSAITSDPEVADLLGNGAERGADRGDPERIRG